MRIVVNNPNGIVTSAFALDHGKALSVFVNLKIRWMEHAYTSSSKGEWAVGYYPDENSTDDKPDEVQLFSRTKRERDMLKYYMFTQLNKDQLWVLFVPPLMVEGGKHIFPKKERKKKDEKQV
jgi:hypothetical protein